MALATFDSGRSSVWSRSSRYACAAVLLLATFMIALLSDRCRGGPIGSASSALRSWVERRGLSTAPLDSDREGDDDDSGSSAGAFHAEVIHREGDGLIVVRPVNWYVYYAVDGRFYLSNTAASAEGAPRACDPAAECVVFAAVEDWRERKSELRASPRGDACR